MLRFMFSLMFIILFSVVPVLANTSTLYQPIDKLPDFQEMNSIFNPSQFKISHQMSFNYGTSSAGYNQMTGLYLSTIDYNTDSPLKIKFHLGYKHQPDQYSSFGADSGVIPGVSLIYRFRPGQTVGLSYGINEYNSFVYNYLDHEQKPFDLWYKGSFLNDRIQLNVNVSNYPNYYNNRQRIFDPWPSNRQIGFQNSEF